MQRQKAKINYTQTGLINLMNSYLSSIILKNTGMRLDPNGVCSGLTCRYLLNKGKADENVFFRKLATVFEPTFGEQSAEQNLLIAEISRLQDPSKYKSQGIQQGDLDKLFPKEIERTYTLGARFEVSHLVDLFKDTVLDEQMVYLAANGHAIAAYKRFNTYYVYDANSEEGEKSFLTTEEFTNYVKTCLFIKPEHNSVDLTLKSFQYKNTHHAKLTFPSVENIAARLSPIVDNANYHTMIWSASVNDINLFKYLLDHHSNPLQMGSGGTPFQMACVCQSEEIVFEILSRYKQIPIPEDLLAAGLQAALRKGNNKIANALIDYANIYANSLIKTYFEFFYKDVCKSGNVQLVKRIESFNLKATPDMGLIKEAIRISAKKGNTQLLQYLLNSNPAIVKESNIINEALEEAIKKGKATCFNELFKHVTLIKSEMLADAIIYHQPVMLKILLARKQVVPNNILSMIATFSCNYQALEILAKEKINGKPIFPELELALSGNLEACKKIIGLYGEIFLNNLLLTAIVNQKGALIEALLTLGVKLKQVALVNVQLIKACEEGNFAIVKALIPYCPNLNLTKKILKEGNKELDLFQLAEAANHPELVALILSKHQSLPQPKLNSLFHYACWAGQVEIIKEIRRLDPQLILSFDPIMMAAKYHREPVVRYLLETGAYSINKDFLLSLCRKGEVKMLRSLLEADPTLRYLVDKSEVVPWIEKAVDRNAGKSIKCLLMLHRPSNILLSEILHRACNQGKARAVDVLLKNGVEFVEPYRVPVRYGFHYRYLLHKAYGLDPDKLDNLQDQTIIQQATLFRHKYIMQYVENYTVVKGIHGRKNLLKNNFKLFSSDPLVKTCREGNLDAFKELIMRKKIDLNNYADLLLLVDNAASKNHYEVVDYIVNRISVFSAVELMDKLLKSQLFAALTAVLESIKPNYLNSVAAKTLNLQERLLAERAKLHEIYREHLGQVAERSVESALIRQKKIQEDGNALGYLFHIPDQAKPPSPK